MNKIHSSVLENFPTNLSVVDIVDMKHLDSDLNGLYSRLMPHKDRVFAWNERLIFAFIDSDYYPSMDSVGNNTHNLFEIIADLDLSTDHMIILATNPGIEKEIQHVCDQKNLSCPKIINFVLWYTFPELQNFSCNLDLEKKFLYSCLNGQPRTHRKTLIAMLYQNNLIDQGMISYHANPLPIPPENTSFGSFDKNNNMRMRLTVPFSRINEELSVCRETKILHTQYSKELAQSIKSEQILGTPNDPETFLRPYFLQQSLVYIVTETVGNYPYPFLTEKTWKAMTSSMPFMVLGAKHSLKFLKECGFKTFNDFWDESYDQVDSVYERCSIIVNNLLMLKNQDWSQLLLRMQPIIEYNFNHVPIFLQEQLKSIKNIL
jgi:hypothetical protein